MISQPEILKQAAQWGVPPDTLEKDHVLGHFLSVFWKRIRPVLIRKMAHKGIVYNGPEQLTDPLALTTEKKAWAASLAHQTRVVEADSAGNMINEVVRKIQENL